MNPCGRPIDPVWQDFYKVQRNEKVCAKCKYYGNVNSNHVEMKKNHLFQCLKNIDLDPDINYMAESKSDLVVPETETQAKKF